MGNIPLILLKGISAGTFADPEPFFQNSFAKLSSWRNKTPASCLPHVAAGVRFGALQGVTAACAGVACARRGQR